ncbi:MAG: hypothetical protein IKO03_13505 [Lachnospiraceae bacterium]|jgi:tetratricopeptide (TPR) repeat protein|nr:hypothetical protein [Lachnospiraceae bacterium]MBR4607641.1 hypothetical protein [Lachnospiraceae bacterium]MBR6150124.1 hypothetical protein [Lachnospiraceae bacterium]
MQAYLCVGEYSSVPYVIQGLELRVYCMEELCYGLKENAFLLDSSIMSDTLLKWIRERCGLPELSDLLYPMVHRQGSLSTFVCAILQYVGLYDGETIRQVDQILKKGAGLSGIEKRKEQVDYLCKKKKYVAAIRGYDGLLIKWEEFGEMGLAIPSDELKANIYHNKGVAYARLMLYGQAGDSFLSAYRISGKEEEYLCFLASKRLDLPESQYVSFASGEMEHYELTLELEKKMEELRRDFRLQPEELMLRERRDLKEAGDERRYLEEGARLCENLKNQYRFSVSE